VYWFRVRDLRRTPVAVVAAACVYLALGVIPDGSVQYLLASGTTALVALTVAVALLRQAGLRGTARQSWLCMGGAALSWGIGEVAHVATGSRDAAGPGLVDLFFLASVALLVVGTLLHPAVATSRLSLLRSVLDGVIIATSLLLLTLMLAAGTGSPQDDGARELLGLVFPLADVVLFGVALMAMSRVGRGNRSSAGLVVVALLCFVAGTDTYELGWPFDIGWLVGFLLLWVASRAPSAVPAEDRPSRRNVLHRVVALLPFASVIVTITAGGTLYFRGMPVTGAITSVGVAMIGAMLVRQSVSVLDAGAAARELARGEAYFRSIVQGSSDVTTIVDENLRVVWQSPSVRTLFGLDESLAVGRSVRDIVHHDDLPALDRALAAVLVDRADSGDGSRPRSASLRARIPDVSGRWRDVETSVANHLHTPAIKGLVLHTRDITERRALEMRLHDMAFTDALTGLPNRRLFLERVEEARQRLTATREPYTVLAVDLDGFKAVNDLHGHASGDALLVQVGARLRAAVRGSDTVARLGGDEFAVLVAGAGDEGIRLGERLVGTLAEPYALGQVTAHVSGSVGVAEAVAGDDSAVVLRNADLALRHAKQTGKRRVEVYEPAFHQGALDRVAIEHDLAGALERGEIRLAYQPIFDLSQDRVVGAEALMRWSHPVRGEVSPADFIPVAEESGQIVELGRWALGEACRQLATWDAAGYTLQMGVNVSTRQFRGGSSLLADVEAACGAHGVPPSRIVLEITESAFLDSFDSVLAELDALHDLGAHIALDDFGTGYSSLSYLRRLPVDILKIDREFVSGMTTEDHVAALAELVVRLGDRLGIEVVAEGVETAAEVSGVLGIGCVLGQGFHLGRPVGPGEFGAVLAGRGTRITPGPVPGVTV
jgi:diguanylate cyclase (GGDEF)-like protein/PAS domain S-box-containing protein